MVTPSKLLQASGHRSKARGLLLAGGILFVIGIGGSGLLAPELGGPQSAILHLGAQA